MTVYQRTTKLQKKTSGALGQMIYARVSGAWSLRPIAYKRAAGAWVPFYSTIDFGWATNTINKTGSGASASGRTYSDYGALAPFVVGTWSGTGHWLIERLGGDGAIWAENPGDPNTRFYRDFSGVANGTTSGTASGSFRLWVYDDVTGASGYADFTVNLAWQNTIPSFSPHTNTYRSGSGTEFVPAGATTLTIRRVGGGGGGGNAVFNVPLGDYKGGNGGGSGAYSTQTIAISPSDYGAPIYWSVGAGSSGWPNIGAPSSTTGALAAGSVNGSIPGGAGGAAGAQVVAGAGVGGSPNGNNGTSGGNGTAGAGGAAVYGGWGKGGNGGYPGGGAAGDAGTISFEWGGP